MNLPERLFWDIDLSTLNEEDHSLFIIERVLQRGDIPEWYILRERYGKERLMQEVVKIRNLDTRTMIFLSNLLDIPKNKFKCCSQIR